MVRLSSVIDIFEADFLAQYRGQLRPEHCGALAAMKHCRTQSSLMQVSCTECSHQSLIPHSCGHRNCPHCQHHESQQWLERQMKKQVPAEYLLLTFSVPAEFRILAFAHHVVYELMMRCAWETVRTFSHNDKQLQGTPGAIAVLHTNTRRLDFHPHVHLVMPAAAIAVGSGKQWRTKRRGKGKKGYLFNHEALAKVFRGKLLAGIVAAALTLPGRYPEKWVVDCKSVGSGEPALIYLGRYLYCSVVREKDIVACKDGLVSFRYQNAKTGRTEQRTVTGADFLWLRRESVCSRGCVENRLSQGIP